MSIVITKEDLIAYAEVDYIIKHMNEKYRVKVPETLLNFFETIKDPTHKIDINPYKPLQEQGLMKYTLEIIALLHIKYWCEDSERKEELLEKMRKNQEKLEIQLKEKFGTDKLFENNTNKINENELSLEKIYSKYTKNNPDIQDYTDLNEEPIHEEMPQKIEKEISILSKIKTFILKIFHKKDY